mmetsp:Transcript_15604/g.23637  ORF Transcript_15604/g.23637 Transcript_15604/m.23637 type:complete len:247 (-) Transcript_15604:155-895(-)|eukprot:CAMPEP_0178925384 /NCGR_PEP_ID=MMETSP0786-20121207/17882_1 /TAXON_ID=186022 /ORGANISM="Thalassionema frauenfeldii, Strain CCMP 1798" /LENGTH=246 /DNA_ID=CAMNT_0020600259 /DNA_START=77 /DNA_END=817 /DNA_ORIENTATION=-
MTVIPFRFLSSLLLVVVAILPSNNNKHICLAFSPATSTAVIQSISHFYESQPSEAAMVTCAVKACSADLVAQIRQSGILSNIDNTNTDAAKEDGNPYDFERTLSFLLYGAFYQGLAQHFIYNHLFTDWFGDGHDPLIVATKVLCDMALVSPFLPLPLSYSIKSMVGEGSTIRKGLEKYTRDVIHQDLLFKYWAFWMPVQVINFEFIPEQFRILFMAAFSFVWTIILSSTMSSSADASATQRVVPKL